MYSLYPKIKNKQQQNTNMSQPIVIHVRLLMYIYLKALLCGQVTGQCISIHITTGLIIEIILYNSMLGKSAKKFFAKPFFLAPSPYYKRTL